MITYGPMGRFSYLRYDTYSTEMQAKFKAEFEIAEREAARANLDPLRKQLKKIHGLMVQKQLEGRAMDYASEELHCMQEMAGDEGEVLELAPEHKERMFYTLEVCYMWVGKAIRDWQLKRAPKDAEEEPARGNS